MAPKLTSYFRLARLNSASVGSAARCVRTFEIPGPISKLQGAVTAGDRGLPHTAPTSLGEVPEDSFQSDGQVAPHAPLR